jgi:hypothetical protein
MWSSIGGVGTSNYPTDKLAYQTIKRLNQVKAFLSTFPGFDSAQAKPITPKGSQTDAALKRDRMVFVITNVSEISTASTATLMTRESCFSEARVARMVL